MQVRQRSPSGRTASPMRMESKTEGQVRADTTRSRHGVDFFSRIGSKGADARRLKRAGDPTYLARLAAQERHRQNMIEERHLRSYVHVLEEELRARRQGLAGASSPVVESQLDYLSQLRQELDTAHAQLLVIAQDEQEIEQSRRIGKE